MYVTQHTIHEETNLETVGIHLLVSFPVQQGVKKCQFSQMCTILPLVPSHYSDVQCGQLHCVVGDYQLTADVSVTILTVSASVDRCR